MAESKRVDGLEINEDPAFQERSWKVQRIGWLAGLLLLVAAALGLFGPGPLSSTSAGEPGSALFVEYDHFVRYQSPAMWKVEVGPGAARDGELRIGIGRELADSVQMAGVVPEPERVEALPDGLVYVFAVPDPTHPTRVTFDYEPNVFGRMAGRVGIDGGPSHEIGAFVYP